MSDDALYEQGLRILVLEYLDTLFPEAHKLFLAAVTQASEASGDSSADWGSALWRSDVKRRAFKRSGMSVVEYIAAKLPKPAVAPPTAGAATTLAVPKPAPKPSPREVAAALLAELKKRPKGMPLPDTAALTDAELKCVTNYALTHSTNDTIAWFSKERSSKLLTGNSLGRWVQHYRTTGSYITAAEIAQATARHAAKKAEKNASRKRGRETADAGADGNKETQRKEEKKTKAALETADAGVEQQTQQPGESVANQAKKAGKQQKAATDATPAKATSTGAPRQFFKAGKLFWTKAEKAAAAAAGAKTPEESQSERSPKTSSKLSSSKPKAARETTEVAGSEAASPARKSQRKESKEAPRASAAVDAVEA